MPQVYSSFNSNHREKNYFKKPFYKTKGFYILLIVIVAVGGFVVWSLAKGPAPQPQLADQNIAAPTAVIQDAEIKFLSGQAEYLPSGASDWVALSFTQKINIGDSVRTLAASKAEISFPNGSMLRLAEETLVTINQIDDSEITIEQFAGSAYHRVKSGGSITYKVIANENELTAQGTAFNTETKNEKELRLTVVESQVKVKVYQDNKLLNMKTINQGELCLIDKTKDQNDIIATEKADPKTLLKNEWLSWNKEQDNQKNFNLGIFAEEVKLEISNPASAEQTTAEDSFIIKGQTEADAKITIAGVAVGVTDDYSFEHELELSDGKNIVEIIADKGDSQTKKTITINYDKDTAAADSDFKLTAAVSENDVKLTWSIDESKTLKGFKLVMGGAENPAFPQNESLYIVQNEARSYTWQDVSEGVKHFRVCVYAEGGKCEPYSNDVKVTIDKQETQKSGSISLSGSTDGGSAKLSWQTSDLDAIKGFKVVKSGNANPSYPGDSNNYLSDPATRSFTWKDLSAGTYHFRVCDYTGSGCNIYSNDITVTIKSSAPSPAGTISLSGSVSNNSVVLKWSTSNVDAPNGFKIVKSTSPNPVYPGDDYKYLSDSAARSVTWEGLAAGTYHFRACQYIDGKCGVYSNDIALTISESSPAPQTGSISLSGSSSDGKANLSWSTSGTLSFDKGYKVVVSESPNPVYPGNEYHYLTSPTQSSDTWTGLEVGKIYHFRVCQYLGGSCGVYSNDIMLTIQ
ncbi:MAG: FecR domain-containing protein [Patescibacteria group bacterium]